MSKITKLVHGNNVVSNAREIANEVVSLIQAGKMSAPELEEIFKLMHADGRMTICNELSDGISDLQAEIHFAKCDAKNDISDVKQYFNKMDVVIDGYDGIDQRVVSKGMVFMQQFL